MLDTQLDPGKDYSRAVLRVATAEFARRLGKRSCAWLMGGLLTLSGFLAFSGTAVQALTCTSSIGPGIPAPSAVTAGIPGFHAAWFGQSGYMTLCPGATATATVAYYNSGSLGWVAGAAGQTAFLGTWNPEPGQDRPSALGGDGTAGSPATGWPRYNRLASQPAPYVGPGQVAWFQFRVAAPMTPGTYRIALRPLVEGATWMEDYGVFWVVTVPSVGQPTPSPTPTPTPTPTPIPTPLPTAAPLPSAPPPTGTVISTCIATFSGWSPDALFELCNGQVWLQTSFEYSYYYAYQAPVTIIKTSYGWMMSLDGVSGSVAVTRVAFLRSCIDGTFNGWDGTTLFPLCNGQIWQQASYAYHYHYAYRPSVLIYESPYGGYYMVVGGDSTPLRVNRIH